MIGFFARGECAGMNARATIQSPRTPAKTTSDILTLCPRRSDLFPTSAADAIRFACFLAGENQYRLFDYL
jgi:hypothetical protein